MKRRGRGQVLRRNGRWYPVIDLGEQIARRCTACGKRHWIERKTPTSCRRCGGELGDALPERRQAYGGGFATRTEAERALTDTLGRMDRGEFKAPESTTLAEYLASWLVAVATRIRPTTLASYERIVTTYVIPAIGGVPLRKLDPLALDHLYARLLHEGANHSSKGLSARSVRHVHVVLHTALGDALKKGLVTRNVADAATPPKPTNTEMRTWSAQELRRFLDGVAEDRLAPVWMLASSTGMRRGEILGVRWCDVDLDASRLAVQQTLLAVGAKVFYGTPKTRRGKRNVPLDPRTVGALRAWKKRKNEERLALGPSWKDNGLVFTEVDGSPINPDKLTYAFEARVRAMGLPRIRLHDLRHTFATLALRAGVAPKVVSEVLGHSTISITLDTYTHAVPSMQEDATSRVAALIWGD